MAEKTKRIGIYLIYDKEGIVDDYIPFLLEKIMPELSRLVIVCNGIVNDEGKRKLPKISEEIYIRNNRGYDAGGFKDALTKYLKWEDIYQYDELLLFNDSFFGPFDSFSHVFSSMEQKEVDFWSLTKDNGYTRKVPAIQSYFIVIRKSLLHAECFKIYWEDMPYFETFIDVLNEYEAKFANYFERLGYKWDAYINMEEYDCKTERMYAFSPYHNLQYELMKQQRYPVLKKKLFALDADTPDYGLNRKMQENFTLALEYIDTHSDYNMNLVWDNILRIYNLRDIQDSCCLRYILPYESKRVIHEEKKTVIFIWLRDQSASSEYIDRVKESIDFCDYVIFVETEELQKKINKVLGKNQCKIINTKKNNGIAYLLLECIDIIKNYKYFAVLHDYDCQPTYDIPYTVEASHTWGEAENILGRREYIQQVEGLFEAQERLGLLVTPFPIHAHYLGKIGDGWGDGYFDIERLADYLDIQKYIQESKNPADWSTCFWCRSVLVQNELADKLKNERFEKFSSGKLLERVLPYYIQKQGYYSGTVETAYYAKISESILYIYLKGLVESCKGKYPFADFCQLREREKIEKLNQVKIREFLAAYENVYVYGTGKIAEDISRYAQGCKAYIVSDGQKKLDEFYNKKVWYLSEIAIRKNDGIILALDRKHRLEVLPVLRKLGYEKNILELEI